MSRAHSGSGAPLTAERQQEAQVCALEARYAAVVAGVFNSASGPSAFIGGGDQNLASGDGASVVAGSHNTASGTQSLAGGAFATASHARTFVWSGAANGLTSSADGQFAVAAPGGFYLSANGGAASVPVASFLSTDTGAYLSTGGAWTNNSDRAKKALLQPVDPRAVLAEVESLPIYRWNYRAESPSVQHLGPMAQDFAKHFRLGVDDTHIATIDADGVALAAVQALARISREQARLIGKQQERLNALEARLRKLEGHSRQ